MYVCMSFRMSGASMYVRRVCEEECVRMSGESECVTFFKYCHVFNVFSWIVTFFKCFHGSSRFPRMFMYCNVFHVLNMGVLELSCTDFH